MVELAITDSQDPAIQRAIERVIDAYNDTRLAEPGNGRILAIPIRDASGKIAGGLWGYSYARWLFVHLLVVPESLRGQGIGTRMMKMAEDEARARGCVGIHLDTFSFQARPFYEKLGFSRFGSIEDWLPGVSRHFLLKRL